jgi:nucleoside-diphosphate-sugar epimerase
VLTDVLAREGYEVIGYDSGVFRDVAFVPRPSAVSRQITKDIRDAEPSDFEGVDAVVHLAALSNDPLGSLNPEATYAVNHRATVRVAEAAKSAGVRRFLFSSSCSMYGVSSESFVTESASFNPRRRTPRPRSPRSAICGRLPTTRSRRSIYATRRCSASRLACDWISSCRTWSPTVSQGHDHDPERRHAVAAARARA